MQLGFEDWVSAYAIVISVAFVKAYLVGMSWRDTAQQQGEVLNEQTGIMIDQRNLIEHQRGLLGAIEPVSTETLDQLH